MIPVKISATGKYLPEKVVTNEDFVREFGNKTSPKALERLLGTKEHRVAASDEQPSDLIVKAAERTLEKAGITAREITQIIVSMTPGDFREPATAAVVQRKLGAQCPGMDIALSCTGWLAGVDIAARRIATSSNEKGRILVLGGALLSRTLPVRIAQHRAIFGDGAGGILLEKAEENEESCIYESAFVTFGEYSDVIHWPNAWSHLPEGVPDGYRGYFYMGESKLLSQLLQRHLEVSLNTLWGKTGFGPSDIDFAIIHQPSGPLFEIAIKSSGIPGHKITRNFERYGNTVSGELPIGLDEAIEEGKIKRGSLLLLVTYGAGITGGCMLLRY